MKPKPDRSLLDYTHPTPWRDGSVASDEYHDIRDASNTLVCSVPGPVADRIIKAVNAMQRTPTP